MERDSTLKPCPFCGGKGHLSSREIRFIGQNYFGTKKIHMGVQVICGRCKARGGLITGTIVFDSYGADYLKEMSEKAAEAWDGRAEG